jgi:hypothetical protein
LDNFKREKLSAYFVSGGRNKTHNNDKFVRYFGKFRYAKKNGLVMLMEVSPENTTEMMSMLLTGAMRQKQFMIHMVGFQIQVLG